MLYTSHSVHKCWKLSLCINTVSLWCAKFVCAILTTLTRFCAGWYLFFTHIKTLGRVPTKASPLESLFNFYLDQIFYHIMLVLKLLIQKWILQLSELTCTVYWWSKKFNSFWIWLCRRLNDHCVFIFVVHLSMVMLIHITYVNYLRCGKFLDFIVPCVSFKSLCHVTVCVLNNSLVVR